MSQTSPVINYDQSGAAVGIRLDEVFASLRSSHSGPAAPTDPLPGQPWADTSVAGQINFRIFDAANWRLVFTVDTTTGVLTLPNMASQAEAEAGTSATKVMTPQRVQQWGDAKALQQGLHAMPIGAASFMPQETNGAGALASEETGIHNVVTEFLTFAATPDQHAQFWFRAPKSVDEAATLSGVLSWMESAGATAHGVAWRVEMQAQGDADSADAAWGAAVVVNDTGTAGTRRDVPFSGVAPAGGWTEGDWIGVRVSRATADANDTLDVDARFLGLVLHLPVTAKDDA